MNKFLIGSVLGLVVLTVVVLYFSIGHMNLAPTPCNEKDVLVVGWDGSRRAKVEELLGNGELPNLQKLIDKGSYIQVNIHEGRTDTKAGWAQIWTGYSASRTGVYSNRKYRPIPAGWTAFERLRAQFGDSIRTAFVSGKINNIGARGPHKICENCKSRFDDTRGKTHYWDESKTPELKIKGEKPRYVEREGEPYFHAKPKLDFYQNALGESSHVMQAGLDWIEKNRDKPFLAFLHFEEPDELGHLYGENSTEYHQALINNDRNLAEILRRVPPAKNRPLITFVLSDHGFNPGEKEHGEAPETFWVSDMPGLVASADRRDFTPTLLQLYCLSTNAIDPPLDGRSLRP
ncbi:MAG: alkaline phosphatase family protein [Bdellovibrionales bacterium]